MDSEELEALEEEEKFVKSLVKKGTMQKQGGEISDSEDLAGYAGPSSEAVFTYEKGKMYRQVRDQFFTPAGLVPLNLAKEVTEMEASCRENTERLAALDREIDQCSGRIEATKEAIAQTGTLFVRAKEATDVLSDFQEMLYGDGAEEGLAQVIKGLVAQKV